MGRAEQIRILLLEDSEENVEMLQHVFLKGRMNFLFKHVIGRDSFKKELSIFKPDIILSAYLLHGFSGLEALKLVLTNSPNIPFIIVTDSINEETAVACIKQGATDYITKENISRLVPAIYSAIEQFEYKQDAVYTKYTFAKSENKYIHAFNYANIGMCLVDLEGKFLRTNAKFSKLCGYSEQDLLNKTVYDITFDADVALTRQFYKGYMKNGKISAELEKRYHHKNGSIVWVFISISLVKSKTGQTDFFVSHIQDITQRKKDEEIIRKLSKSVEQSPVMVLITNMKGEIEYVNDSFKKITGFKTSEVINKSPKILQSGFHDKEFYKLLWTTVLSGQIWAGEFLNKKKNGEKYWEASTISTINDARNIPTHILAIKQDITKQKELEQALIKAKLKAEESDRLKTAFLANVSHEIRTPMNGIIGFSEILSDDSLMQEMRQKYVQIIKNCGDQLLRIIDDILDISKIESHQFVINKEEFQLKEIIHGAELIVKELVLQSQKKIQIITQIQDIDKELIITADKMRISQVLHNLISNAFKFTNEGEILVRYKIQDQHLFVDVSDTGIGIKAENLNTIFERFRQVNETVVRGHGGTGLGLPISKGLVVLMGGKIQVKSVPDKGSTFSFSIPIKIGSKSQIIEA